MEKEIKIPTTDSKKIYGTLKGDLSKPLIIFIHGFTCNKNEHIIFNGAKYFENKGFSSYRFDLYSWQKDARKISECTIDTHIADLKKVVEYFKDKVVKIFVIGHSFGGPVITHSNLVLDGAVLWDPTDSTKYFLNTAEKLKELNMYWDKLSGVLLSADFIDSLKSLDFMKPTFGIEMPIKIICAGDGILHAGWKKEIDKRKPKNIEFEIVKGASHCFDEEGKEEELFEKTLTFLQNQNKDKKSPEDSTWKVKHI